MNILHSDNNLTSVGLGHRVLEGCSLNGYFCDYGGKTLQFFVTICNAEVGK